MYMILSSIMHYVVTCFTSDKPTTQLYKWFPWSVPLIGFEVRVGQEKENVTSINKKKLPVFESQIYSTTPMW